MEQRWLDIIARIAVDTPTDVDDILGAEHERGDVFATTYAMPPAARLWEGGDETSTRIGIRVTTEEAVTSETALRLAAAAAERNIVPIILSHIGTPGFERFGFRVERVVGDTAEERGACEAELSRFWNLAIVIDAEQVSALR